MKLESIEYKELLNAFGDDVREINDDLYQASKPKASEGVRDAIMRKGREKLRAYDALLARLEGAQRENAEKRFGELMVDMRESLTKLEASR